MKLKKTFVFLLLLFTSISESHARILEQTFEDYNAGFAISIPQDWYLEPRGLATASVQATLKFEAPVDQFIPNTTVRVGLLEKNQTNLQGFLATEREGLNKNLKILEEKDVPAKQDAWPLGYQWKLENSSLGVIFLQRFFVVEGKIYILTATSKKISWNRFEKDFEQILNSFRWLSSLKKNEE